MFTHIIMTRFNIATAGREEAIRNQPGWLDERFYLFEKYCLSSVASQKNRKFDWIIYFDEDTPYQYKNHITSLQKTFPFYSFYTPLFPSDGWLNSINKIFLNKKTDLLVTTRLDNDDSISDMFVDRLQAEINKRNYCLGAYNFDYGLVRNGSRLYLNRHTSNPFFTWVENWDQSAITAPAIPHMEIQRRSEVFHIGGQPAWLQVVHGRNVSNRTRGKVVLKEKFVDLFCDSALEGIENPGVFWKAADNTIFFIIREIRDLLVVIIKNLFRK